MSSKVMKDVKSKGVVVGQIEIEVYDNMDECSDGLTDDVCVRLINKMNAIEIMDNIRREATGSTSTGTRELMKRLKEDPERMAALLAEYDIQTGAQSSAPAADAGEGDTSA